MRLKNIYLKDFRSYGSGSFAFSDGVNIITGENGRGKTNLLEGIYLLCGCRSWRCGKRAQLIRWDMEKAVIEGRVFSRGRDFDCKITLPQKGRGKAEVNGVGLSSFSLLGDAFRCVLFSPEDLYIVRGGSDARRAFLNDVIGQLRPMYGQLLTRYGRLLLSKNKVLKNQDGGMRLLSLLPEYDAQLASCGARIMGYRRNFILALEKQAAQVHLDISGGRERLSLRYRAAGGLLEGEPDSGEIQRRLLSCYEQNREKEMAAGSCLYGPHRDEMEILIDGKSARHFASQGQARSACLSLRFGQRELFCSEGGEAPVLLLDDVLSELDEGRRDFITGRAGGGQSIITCCDGEDFPSGSVIKIQ